MGTSFGWPAQSNYVLYLHALVAKTADASLAQGAHSTDSVAIEYIIICVYADAAMQEAAHGGWRGPTSTL